MTMRRSLITLLALLGLLLATSAGAEAARGHGAAAVRHPSRCTVVRGHHGRHHPRCRPKVNRRRGATGPAGSGSTGAGSKAPGPTAGSAGALAAGSTGDCSAADQTPSAANLAAVESAALCLVNQQRTSRGETALTVNPILQGVAIAHSLDMVARDYFDHTTPSGVTAAQRVLSSGYVPAGTGYTIGENIAWGTGDQSTPRAIVTAWMNSPEHRANILDPTFRQTGMGVAAAAPASFAQGQDGGTYTQEFGAIS